MKQFISFVFVLAFVLAVPKTPAQIPADPQLAAAIERIKAIDNHAHPLRYISAGEKPDTEFDALPLDAIGPMQLPVRLNPGNLEFVNAWRDLYGYKHDDMIGAHLSELLQTKQRVANEQGEKFRAWVLDQLNIATIFP